MRQLPTVKQAVSGAKDWAKNNALDWERDFMSEETKRDKELLDMMGEGLSEAQEFVESNPEIELLIP